MSDPARRVNWIKYVRWDVIARWRRSQVHTADRAFPYAFASRDSAFPNIGHGVLWLVSSPRFQLYRLPPALIARLDVGEVVSAAEARARGVDPQVERFAGSVALGAREGSAYFPLNNMTRLLQRLRFEGRVSRLPPSPISPAGQWIEAPYAHIPRHFQRHRVLDPRSVETLENYAASVQQGRRAFISYRWSDFRDRADWLEEFATVLDRGGVACWLDQWNVPAARVGNYADALLGAVLDDGVRQSAWFIALMGSNYVHRPPDGAPQHWARQEWEAAHRAKGMRRRDPMNRVAVSWVGGVDALADWLEPEQDVVIEVGTETSGREAADRVLAVIAS